MAAVDDTYAFAWVLQLGTPPFAIMVATTDLPDATGVLGAAPARRIKNLDAVLQQSLPNLFYGIDVTQNITFTLDNADGIFSSLDLRLVPAVVGMYDRIGASFRSQFEGLVISALMQGTECIVTLGSIDPSLFNLMLPAAVISKEVGSPFETANTPNVPVPVVFGGDVLVQPPVGAVDTVSSPGGTELLVGFDAQGNYLLQVPSVFSADSNVPNGLLQESDWTDAPGSPVYVSTKIFSVTGYQKGYYSQSPNPDRTSGVLTADAGTGTSVIAFNKVQAGKHFRVGDAVTLGAGDVTVYSFTNNVITDASDFDNGFGAVPAMSVTPPLTQDHHIGDVITITQMRFAGGRIRFKTTASAGEYLYAHIDPAAFTDLDGTNSGYDDTVLPNRVQIDAALFDAGLTGVQLNGDWEIVPYTNITAGLVPEPISGQTITAIRTPSAPQSPNALVRGSGYKQNTRYASSDILEILTNTTWGLSAGIGAAQTIDAGSFSTAATNLNAVGSGPYAGVMQSAVNGALAYDQHQRQALGPINEILMMRGMRLWQDSSLAFHIDVDTDPEVPAFTFHLGPGDTSAIKIKKVLQHGFAPLDRAIRNVVLNWNVGGSAAGGALNALHRFTPRAYAQTSTAACTGKGQDLVITSQWITIKRVAEIVAYYIAQKLLGADETCQILVGMEGRDVTLGQAITITVPSDGISGDWQVSALARTLTETTLTCFRLNHDAYGNPVDVVTTNPGDAAQGLISGQFGTNEVPNPDFAPPLQIDPSFASQVPPDPLPHGWKFDPVGGADLTLPTVIFQVTNPIYTPVTTDASTIVRASTIAGHYITIVIDDSLSTGLHPFPPVFPAMMGIFSDPFPIVKVNQADMLRLVSVYCDQADGLICGVGEFDVFHNQYVSTLLPLRRLDTDTNPMGWSRFYAPWRPRGGTALALIGIGFTRTGTFRLEAVEIQRVGTAANRPPPWQRHRTPPQTLTGVFDVTFDGRTGPYTDANAIPAGAYVIGVNTIVTSTVTYGTATLGYMVGTDIAHAAWVGDDTVSPKVGATNTGLGTKNNVNGTFSNVVFFATGATVQLQGIDSQGNELGTITAGSMRVQIEYTLGAPVSGV